MITVSSERLQEVVSSIRPHTYSSIEETTKYKLPFIITADKEYISEMNKEDNTIKFGSAKSHIVNCKKFHYKDKWYAYKYSADNPEDTFGILRVDNLPFRTFDSKMDKSSFICRMDRLIYDGLVEPFVVFVDNKMVNLNYVDVVYDCGDIYLLLHGDQYNWYYLEHAEILLMVLPFRCEYIGEESNEYWIKYYNMLVQQLQESLTDNNGKLSIKVPTMQGEYEYNEMVYNTGAWLYTQIRMNYLGLLSTDRVNKLKKISLVKYEYDEAGNVTSTYTTKFNALDRDVYDVSLFESICYMPYVDYLDKTLFRFNSKGLYDENGSNMIFILDDDYYVDHYSSRDAYIYNSQASIDNTLFRNNYVIFEAGLFNEDKEITFNAANTTRIDNPDNRKINIVVVYYKKTAKLITVTYPFDRAYIAQMANKYIDLDSTLRTGIDAHVYNDDGELETVIERVDAIMDEEPIDWKPKISLIQLLNYDDAERKEVMELYLDYLDYSFSDALLYDKNISNGLDAIINFDPRLLHDAYNTNIYHYSISGKTANESLEYPLDYENRKGLKIPRMKRKNHETYVMVFVNGILYENYYKTMAFANYFFIPVESKFSNGDVIEFVFFTMIDNNQIDFEFTSTMIDDLELTEDGKFFKMDIFSEYIKPEELKIFAKYPSEIMHYQTLITENDDIAFNVSYRDDKDNLYVYKEVIDPTVLVIEPSELLSDIIGVVPFDGNIPSSAVHDAQSGNVTRTIVERSNWIIDGIDADIETSYHKNYFTAVSKRKFIYQRLYVEHKAYRIKIGRRFKYCDNQAQYMLFINGRKMENDSFLITIPKHTRPFWGMYLYTAKFVNPEDRIELFYVPDEITEMNREETPVELSETGYVETNKNYLEVPYDKDFYMFFLNGKKVPNQYLINVDSHRLKIAIDLHSMKRFSVSPTYTSTIPQVTEYLKSNKNSIYDELINRIMDTTYLNHDELNKLFNDFTKLTNTEEDMLNWNVDRIAIINEIVRDFWVTSGYPYNEVPFIYDYALDEIIYKDENGNYILPALDANPYINIPKQDIHLLYFTSDPDQFTYELGRTLDGIKFFWEYSSGIFGNPTIISQFMNEEDIGTESREYDYNKTIDSDITFTFEGNTTSSRITKVIDINFYNGVYFGVIDEDELQYFYRGNIAYFEDLIAVVPKGDTPIPTSAQHEADSGDMDRIKEDNNLIYQLSYDTISVESREPYYQLDWTGLVNINDPDLIAICTDGTILRNIIVTDATTGIPSYTVEDDLQHVLPRLDYTLQNTVEMDLKDYIIGANNYFLFAAPKRLVYDENGYIKIEFVLPDVTSEEIRNYRLDEHTLPVYTDGSFNESNQLVELDKMEMNYLGEFMYTNAYGYSELYMVWKSNGFFTRRFEDYKFHIRVRDTSIIEDTIQTEFDYDETIIEDSTITDDSSINTTSINGVDVTDVKNSNGSELDNIVMIDDLLIT